MHYIIGTMEQRESVTQWGHFSESLGVSLSFPFLPLFFFALFFISVPFLFLSFSFLVTSPFLNPARRSERSAVEIKFGAFRP